ncbi:uncharacterized protein LOC125260459 isoform X2 [Megalobrama amblycephala]|uniref:uncharacterized protein LOC125260459 isoform X2 n=1 Tax=Megalobrama amblycephala TaxID=75352 RepID=UPI00201482B3|nr:uncharacterized protein LOC125260459 isoform X2 [Megalobrama amblycephala]
MQRTNMFKSASSQLLLLDQKCAKCLLETYVKRSLSLNEGCRKHRRKQLNRVRRDERESQARRASSDTSTHRLSVEKHLKISKCTECTTSASDLRCESPKGPSKTKRRSLVRGFLNLFSKKKSDLKVNGEGVSETDCGQSIIERGIDHTKSLRKKHSLKKILFRNQKVEQRESLQTDFTPVPADEEQLSHVSVGSSNTYFETVSEELELIVKKIQFSPKDDPAPLPSAARGEDFSSADQQEQECPRLPPETDVQLIPAAGRLLRSRDP